MAGSTSLKTQHGDQAVGELIARHRTHVGHLAARCGGRVVDWAGDGCFLTFETPSSAVSFGLGLQQVHAAESDLPAVRVGIHMGEVEILGDDVAGVGVHLAARISALAQPGEVLVSRTVRDLLLGSAGTFVDRGIHDLKGVPGTWEILAVVDDPPA